MTSQDTLFSFDPSAYLPSELAGLAWPDAGRFPVNHAARRVRQQVWQDLITSRDPVVVAGFASIAQLIDLSASWARERDDGVLRVLLGTEPFATQRSSFASPAAAFTSDARRYWIEEEGVSLRTSAKIVQTLALLDQGRLQVCFVHGQTRLHAKIYVGSEAASVGSSNFTSAGLGTQVEANARFSRSDELDRYSELASVAENLWSVGSDWSNQFRDLLNALLRFVGWQEALARACADLLEGEWASRYILERSADRELWPSQKLGIAQALWIAENVGSVLVADATGSGKTMLGAHLVRAVRDRMWNSGRVRQDLTVLVCPPPVRQTWFREAVSCGVSLYPVSHGLLSRASKDGPRAEEDAVKRAQILAIDEAHNFLGDTNRTRQVRASEADHVLLFTATPINRGASDLLQLVGLLGADNFDDETLAILDRLYRRRSGDAVLSEADQRTLRREIQRFTVRRTKRALNALVDEDPDAYRSETGRVCRYPRHEPRTYDTGETSSDCAVALTIRSHVAQLRGIALLAASIAVPTALRAEYTDERWLQLRLASARGLAAHNVLGALRSSRAALVEHLAGTAEAMSQFSLRLPFKPQHTGNVINTIATKGLDEPPSVELDCEIPDWLTDISAWQEACAEEFDHYKSILQCVAELSGARERAKADLLVELSSRHERVLAFDHHLITLAVLAPMVTGVKHDVIVATGSDSGGKSRVQRAFGRESRVSAIALCSDALNEGLNLQGASAIVHLDLPTTLRVAEQRVGRVDRMDSPHDAIEALWPNDSVAFATHANELLAERAAESNLLLGSNLPMPDFGGDRTVDVETQIQEFETLAEQWDGIQDALEPIRQLTSGPTAIVRKSVYEAFRTSTDRVVARVSPVVSTTPWAFFAVAGTDHGAPRWLLLEGGNLQSTTELDDISVRLRELLADDPPGRHFDQHAEHWLSTFLSAATVAERKLLPRRTQRALDQMSRTCGRWAELIARRGHTEDAERWRSLSRLAEPISEDGTPDPVLVARAWLDLVAPLLDDEKIARRRSRYVVLKDIEPRLAGTPFALEDVERRMTGLRLAAPLDRRVTACILGVPDEHGAS